jgi:hypothetical protein
MRALLLRVIDDHTLKVQPGWTLEYGPAPEQVYVAIAPHATITLDGKRVEVASLERGDWLSIMGNPAHSIDALRQLHPPTPV